MQTKNIFLVIFAIFLSYILLKPLGPMPITKDFYSIKISNVSTKNMPAAFNYIAKGDFFIHPGEKKPTILDLNFTKSYNLSLNFLIYKDAKGGNIKFIVEKNGIPINKNIFITKNHEESIHIPIVKGDKITIKADKNGNTFYDWGEIRINAHEKLKILKDLFIPLLWSIFIIFLLNKRYKYLALGSYPLFTLVLLAEKSNFGFIPFETLFIYTIIIFNLTFILIFLFQELKYFKKYKIATILSFLILFIAYIIPLFFIIYALNFSHEVTKDILFAVFQSNSNEAYEYVSDFISFKYILLFIFILFVMGYLLYKQEKTKTIILKRSLLIIIIFLLTTISIQQFFNIRLVQFITDSFKQYKTELKHFKEVQRKRKAGKIKFKASKKSIGETYIFIIGESLNRKHMGIYGYLRDTTPNLSKMAKDNNLTIFTNTYSNHTHTGPVLSYALTEANQYNHKKYYDSLSIIDILKKANIETFWLTNQTIYGGWDNLVSVIGTSADHLVAMNKHIGKQILMDRYDGSLIKKVKEVLSQKTNKNRVVFVHLMGNHGTYASRYPHDKFTIYKGKLKTSAYGKASQVENINYYDNSIVYNDYVVSSIYKEAQKHKNVLSVMYMSDHADDVINNLAHNSSRFTFYMTQIPMIAWFSNTYKKKYPLKYKNFIHHTKTLFSNDMLYDTLIGIYGIDTNKYNPKYDLSSKKYQLYPQEALTLHGKKHYIDKSNHIYWQKTNAQYLIDINQSNRVFPNHVDTIGKLKDIWNDGFRSFQIDVWFNDRNQKKFTVEHRKGEGDLSFDAFLSSINTKKIEKIILEIKNIENSNYLEVLNRLEFLDRKYNIKNKLIIQASLDKTILQSLKKNGWNSSYILNQKNIEKLLKTNNISELNKHIKLITSILEHTSTISFDKKIYPFVKKYLEPSLPTNIKYNVKHAPALFDTNFKEKLQNDKLFIDKRVKTLLAPYDSQFDF